MKEAIKGTEVLRPGAETELDWKIIEGIAKDVSSCSLAYGEVLNLSIVDLQFYRDYSRVNLLFVVCSSMGDCI